MKCLTLNIQKRLFKALSSIQMILSQYSIDVLFLQEVDIKDGEIPPLLDGYKNFHHTNRAGVIRCITYIRNELGATKLAWEDDMPVVIIQIKMCQLLIYTMNFLYTVTETRVLN